MINYQVRTVTREQVRSLRVAVHDVSRNFIYSSSYFFISNMI